VDDASDPRAAFYWVPLREPLDVLRQRYEAGDKAAALEAVALLGPYGYSDSEHHRLFGPPLYPQWLQEAVGLALWAALREGVDSIREAFGVAVYSGCTSLVEARHQRALDILALGSVLGIQAARKRSRIRYPRGEDAYSLAARLVHGMNAEPVTRETLKQWCSRARRAGLHALPDVTERSRRVALWIECRGTYPPALEKKTGG
jgi:hypothetical protein